MVQIWQVERPELPFDYYAPKYRFCGCSHIKIASCAVLILSLLLILYYIFSLIFRGFAVLQIILLPIEIIALIALYVGLRAEHPVALLPFLLAQALSITCYAYFALRYGVTAIDDESELGFGKEINNKAHPIKSFGTNTSIKQAATFIAISCLLKIFIFSLFFYIVYKCRHYFIDLQKAKGDKEPTVSYYVAQNFN